MMNSGGSIEAAAVMLISVFIKSCTLLEPSVGISISGMTMKNWICAARVGTPCRFRRMVFAENALRDLGEENLHRRRRPHQQRAEHGGEGNNADKAVHQHRRQAEVRRQPFEHLYRTAGKVQIGAVHEDVNQQR